jgi:multidrug efflux pump
MTSLAFILGVVPLVLAEGAGAEMRRSLGTAVFSGMLGVTLFGIFLTPVFFYVIEGLGETPWLAARAPRQVVSLAIGGLVGLASGYLAQRVGVVRMSWAPGIAAAVGMLATLAVVEIHRRLKGRGAATGESDADRDRQESVPEGPIGGHEP